MLKTCENCKKCKYYYHRHCANTASCLDCEMCEIHDVHSKRLCKCISIYYGEDCPYFMKAEEADNGKEL